MSFAVENEISSFSERDPSFLVKQPELTKWSNWGQSTSTYGAVMKPPLLVEKTKLPSTPEAESPPEKLDSSTESPQSFTDYASAQLAPQSFHDEESAQLAPQSFHDEESAQSFHDEESAQSFDDEESAQSFDDEESAQSFDDDESAQSFDDEESAQSFDDDESAQLVPQSEVDILKERIVFLEARIAEQDAALYDVLDVVANWIESDPAHASSSHRRVR